MSTTTHTTPTENNIAILREINEMATFNQLAEALDEILFEFMYTGVELGKVGSGFLDECHYLKELRDAFRKLEEFKD